MIIVVIIMWAIFSEVTGNLAQQRGYSKTVWAFVGLLLGPLGILWVWSLPKKND